MEENKKVIVHFERSDGKTFVIDNMGDWYIPNDGLEGIDFADYNLYTTTTAFGTGVVVTGEGYSARNITITARTINPDIVDMVREQARLFFNPLGYTFKLTITYRGRTRWIDSKLSNLKLPSGNVYQNQDLKLLFLCPDPFFHSVASYEQGTETKKKMWAFPWIDCPTANINPVCDYVQDATSMDLQNDGEENIYPFIQIYFRADIEYPKVSLNNGFVKMRDEYRAGNILEISTKNKKVYKNIDGQRFDFTANMTAESNIDGMFIPKGGATLTYTSKTYEQTGTVGARIRAYYDTVYGGL